jgi:hypothetical protein
MKNTRSNQNEQRGRYEGLYTPLHRRYKQLYRDTTIVSIFISLPSLSFCKDMTTSRPEGTRRG